jgi:hypothetical protein
LWGSYREHSSGRLPCGSALIPAEAPEERDAGGRAEAGETRDNYRPPYPCCGGHVILVERFAPGTAPRTILAVSIDTS